MKQILLILGILYLFSACEREHIMTYNSDAYVQFTKSVTDSSEFSFTFYPNKDTVEYGVRVKLVGLPVDREREYKVVVVDDYTTAAPGNYVLPERCVFEKNEVQSVIALKFIKTKNLQTTPVRLALRLEANENFKVGETAYSACIIWMNDKISRPAWWNSTIQNSYLGDYSDKKYRLFIEVTGQGVLDSTDPVACRYHSLIFRNYLKDQEEMGNIVYEDDGYTKMTVSVIGG